MCFFHCKGFYLFLSSFAICFLEFPMIPVFIKKKKIFVCFLQQINSRIFKQKRFVCYQKFAQFYEKNISHKMEQIEIKGNTVHDMNYKSLFPLPVFRFVKNQYLTFLFVSTCSNFCFPFMCILYY